MLGTLRPGSTLVIATHNEGKVRELAELFAPLGIATLSAGALGLKEPEETGDSFAENAKIKAEAATAGSGMLAVADDSGLEVTALGGAPGIHSARWGGPNKDFSLAMERINRELEALGTADRRANFVCALALAPPRGTRGFGYDPIFVPEGYTETFGEMDPELKNDLSHRMRAFEKLMLATYADGDDA